MNPDIKYDVFLMPGMAANPNIFEFIKLPVNFKIHHLEWKMPYENESISEYALRISSLINGKNIILIGVSFGGILVQEISKIIKSKKVIIISSVKSNKELPLRQVRSIFHHSQLQFFYSKNFHTGYAQKFYQ